MPVVVQRCALSIGDTVDNSYTIVKVLGEGSFGRVYLVCDRNGAKYALKLLKLWEVPEDIRESLIARFDMEFETGRIESDYLVHSISHGFMEGNPYIVMEFCPGGDLLSCNADTIAADTSTIATHVLMGLKALHSCGKVHRDLKPENVLVKKNGAFALTDFGISGDRNKRMTERNLLGKPKQIFGTYAYMPPEQLNPRKDATVLPTTDIFSFGVMMFQLLTGELPFGRLDSERDLVPYINRGKAGDWNKQLLSRTAAAAGWYNLIDGCLKADFHHRLQSVDDVLKLVPNINKVNAPSENPVNFSSTIINGVLLRVMQGEEYGKVYKLDDMLIGERAILLMGRRDVGVVNDIAICENNSSYISRQHCTLELDYDTGSWVIRDGQCIFDTGPCYWKPSTNGTFVNSHEVGVNGAPFSPGDIISIGDTKLRAEAY